MRTSVAFVIALAAAALVAGCDSKKSDSGAERPAQTNRESAPPSGRELLSGGTTPTTPAPAPGQAAPAGATTPGAATAAAPAPASVPFNDSSAEAAVETYMKRLVARDLAGAAAICDPDSPGTAKLAQQAKGLEAASADFKGVDLASLLVEHIKPMTWQKQSEEGDRAVFLLTSPTRPEPQQLEVRKVGGGWRVVPPNNQSGMPT